MNELLVELLNRSIQASILIVAVIILRQVFKRVPKWTICLLWGLVAIRLAFPFTVESPYSLGIKADVIRVDAGTGVGSEDTEVPAQSKQEKGQHQSDLQAQKGQYPAQKRQSSVQGQSNLQGQTAQTREQQQEQNDQTKQQAGRGKKQTTLTMQMLVKMAAADDWDQKQRESSISDWEGYTNLQKSDAFSQDSLTELLYGQLQYRQTTYELDIYYWKSHSGATAGKADSIDMITLRNTVHDDTIVLYDAERGQTTPDLTAFLQKKYKLPNALKKGNINSRKLKGKVTLGTYTTDLFLDFAGCLFQSKRYIAPKHGENTPKAWYSLGGAGVCDSTENAVFQQGQLTEYHYLANHLGSKKITDVVTGKYTGCLYRYTVDLATAAEAGALRKEERTADYWVLFYTTGEGKPVYMKFFNGKYYSAKDALNSIG